ncbi:hypothetical protein AZ78_2631 [Lysobacter capsici AZ78]|uniref:Uncharacterized protein n=1 Tax=Lysobacter capsici AZ78 TaxID=1444315 RepID=A0A108U9K0_9GAMM|nr:hypothetical protein AZ78_2631 [Lysobacter capsici AZ78]
MHIDGQCHFGSAELREAAARLRDRSAEGWNNAGRLGGVCRGSRRYGFIHIATSRRRSWPARVDALATRQHRRRSPPRAP